MAKVAIVILNWNGQKMLAKYLPNVVEYSRQDAEIWVADNNSSDQSMLLLETQFPHVKTIVLVQDNLNIHSKASLYKAFPASEARRLVERFEWHYTPKHGSWLNLAESELGVLSTQCLDRRIPDKQTLIEEIAAWENDRNAHHTKAVWQFTTKTARVKLKHPYPSI